MHADPSCAPNATPDFDELYTEYRRPLLAVIGRFIRCNSEREDVLHDVFLRVHRALPDFRGDSALFTWLYRIAVNSSLNHIRRQSFRLSEGLDCEAWELESMTGDTPESLAIAQQSAKQIADVMAQLDWVNKDAFLLYSRLGLSYEAIAELLNCPVGTVRSRISRTRLSLRNCLSPPQESKKATNRLNEVT